MLMRPWLPLSFGTGIFGMNLQTFGPSWTLHKEITYICLYHPNILAPRLEPDKYLSVFVSIVIIAASLTLGFSPLVRSLLSLALGVSWVWFVTTTRIYDLWFLFLSKQDSSALIRKRLKVTRKWKDEAREKCLERLEKKQRGHEAKMLKKRGRHGRNLLKWLRLFFDVRDLIMLFDFGNIGRIQI